MCTHAYQVPTSLEHTQISSCKVKEQLDTWTFVIMALMYLAEVEIRISMATESYQVACLEQFCLAKQMGRCWVGLPSISGTLQPEQMAQPSSCTLGSFHVVLFTHSFHQKTCSSHLSALTHGCLGEAHTILSRRASYPAWVREHTLTAHRHR